MTPKELKAYAVDLILDHARNVDELCVFKTYKDYDTEGDGEISDDDAKKVLDLVGTATIEVSWPEPKQAA